ncbi:hypothetical protein Hanom_Chr04g00319011 [Helianthus anomalus]
MEEKFGQKDLDSSDSDDDGDDERGDAGVVGASTAGSESDDNQLEPGYEFYLDERGVRHVRKIRQEDDAEYVPSDTEAERLNKKQTVSRRKNKVRKNIGSSSVQQSVPLQEPSQEAEMNPNLGFMADEALL